MKSITPNTTYEDEFSKVIEETMTKIRPEQMKFLKRKGINSWLIFDELPLKKQKELQKQWENSPEFQESVKSINNISFAFKQ